MCTLVCSDHAGKSYHKCYFKISFSVPEQILSQFKYFVQNFCLLVNILGIIHFLLLLLLVQNPMDLKMAVFSLSVGKIRYTEEGDRVGPGPHSEAILLLSRMLTASKRSRGKEGPTSCPHRGLSPQRVASACLGVHWPPLPWGFCGVCRCQGGLGCLHLLCTCHPRRGKHMLPSPARDKRDLEEQGL